MSSRDVITIFLFFRAGTLSPSAPQFNGFFFGLLFFLILSPLYMTGTLQYIKMLMGLSRRNPPISAQARRWAEVLRTCDTDGDGKLTMDEVEGSAREICRIIGGGFFVFLSLEFLRVLAVEMPPSGSPSTNAHHHPKGKKTPHRRKEVVDQGPRPLRAPHSRFRLDAVTSDPT